VVIIVIAAFGFTTWFYLSSRGDYVGDVESVNVVYPKFESLALFWVAEDQSFFIKNGIKITSSTYPSGAATLDALVNGEGDVAVGIAELPLVGKALQGENISAFGSIDRSEFIYLVCRRDSGIVNASDLAGKRVGSASGTVAEFYLGRYLELHGMSMESIVFVDVRTPEEWVNAVVNGDIEAVSIAQPAVNAIIEHLGENAVVLPVQSNQLTYSLLISQNDWIAEHPELVKRFLRALYQAEEYLRNHPNEAKAIVKNHMNFTDGYMETVWRQNRYSLSLDQSLVLAMEDEARWMINNGLKDKAEVPDFLKHIYAEGLESVKPEAVGVIR